MTSPARAIVALAALLLAGAIWYAFKPASPSFVVRYRLTLEIETPQGLRQGSSVIETAFFISNRRAWLAEASGDRIDTKGEAIFVDLGGGRNAIALLTGGARGDWADWHRYFLLGVFRHATGKDLGLADLASVSGLAVVDEATRLAGTPLLPTIITFADIKDPASAKVLRLPTDYTEAFGVGYALRRVTVEIVPNDTPVTRGIEKRLVWMDDPRVIDNPGWMSLPEQARLAITGLRKPYR